MVLAGAGGIDHEYLVELGRKYFGDLKTVNKDFVMEPGRFSESFVSGFFFDFSALVFWFLCVLMERGLVLFRVSQELLFSQFVLDIGLRFYSETLFFLLRKFSFIFPFS